MTQIVKHDEQETLATIAGALGELSKPMPLGRVAQGAKLLEALRISAQKAGYTLEVQNAAAEAKLRFERRAGELLAKMEKCPPGRPAKNGNTALPIPTLSDLGITKMQSSRWQCEALVPIADLKREAGLSDLSDLFCDFVGEPRPSVKGTLWE